MATEQYAQRKAQGSDAGSSVVYIFNPRLDASTRSLIRLELVTIGEEQVSPARRGGRLFSPRLYCEGVFNDHAYRFKYNEQSHSGGIPDPSKQNTIVIGSWYRERLGCDKANVEGLLRVIELEITQASVHWFDPRRWWAAMWL